MHKEEILIRKLIQLSARLASEVLKECNNPGEVPKCMDAAKCLLVTEQLTKSLGFAEDKVQEGTALLNHKLFEL